MDNIQDINKRLEATLNRHGYSFQYSVIRQINDLFTSKKSPWVAPISEFPTEINGHSTRIDLILRYQGSSFFLLIETKRANPALSNWCFLRAPFLRSSFQNRVVAESIMKDSPGSYYTDIHNIDKTNEVCHIALEIKSSEKGDKGSEGRGAIEGAATQVLRGMNGMIQFLSENSKILNDHPRIIFLPVIITTAKLYYSDADISTANLESGNIDLSKDEIKEKDWLFYNYYQSPGLKHSVQTSHRYNDFEKILNNRFVRTIAIVNANGIDAFFCGGLSI